MNFITIQNKPLRISSLLVVSRAIQTTKPQDSLNNTFNYQTISQALAYYYSFVFEKPDVTDFNNEHQEMDAICALHSLESRLTNGAVQINGMDDQEN